MTTALPPSGDDPTPCRVLAVDDDALQRLTMAETLDGPRFRVHLAEDGAAALRALAQAEFDVVLLDRNMPGLDGDTTCRYIRRHLDLPLLPVLMVTGSNGAGEMAASLAAGADDFIRKPYPPVELLARVDSAFKRKRITDQLDSAESLLFALARMVEAKDGTTGDHCSRLARLSVLLGRALGLAEPELQALRRGGVLHDIGKLGVPDAVLTKPAALDPHEWQLMRRHPVIGADLVAGLRSMRLTLPIIRHHHERWDGSGYPDGLRGEAIPLLARVFQVVDIYDALVHARPYKTAMSPAAALLLLTAEADRGWRDPAITRAFVHLVNSGAADADADADGGSDGDSDDAADTGHDDLGIALYRRIALPAAGLAP